MSELNPRFKKAVHFLVMMPGKIPLDLTDFDRKMISVVLKNTIEQGEPQFEVEGIVAGKCFGMPTAEIARMMGLSKMFGYEHLRDSLERLQHITFKMESPSASDNEMPDAPSPKLRANLVLLPTVVHEYRKERETTGSLMTWWKFNEDLVPYLLEPKRYAILRIESITAMQKGPSIALYEICARFASSPTHSTGFKPLDWWVKALTGQFISGPKRSLTFSEFKYFSRDVLVPAVKEINEKTELEVKIELKKVGKKVAEIRFLVRHKAKEVKAEALQIGDLEDASVETLRVRALALKMTDRFFSQLCKTHPVEVLQLAIESIEKTFARRAGNPNAKPIRSSNAYARSVINSILDERNSGQKTLEDSGLEEPAPATPTRPRPKRPEELEVQSTVEGTQAEKLDRFFSLPAEQQDALIERVLMRMEAEAKAKPNSAFLLARPIRDLKNRKIEGHARAAVLREIETREMAQA